MKAYSHLALCLLSFMACDVSAQALYEFFPAQINPGEKYVFYSHGYIVEGHNPIPVHAEFGSYEFPSIKQALFEIGGFNLIAHHRPTNTPVGEYSRILASWVNRLIRAGVDESDITLIGFSRGGHLTALASSQLRHHAINTVIMASCMETDINVNPPIVLGGRFLSIYEHTDGPGSCAGLAARSDLVSFEEVEIDTGRSHGAFYTPMDEWVLPLGNWLRRTGN